MLTHTIDRAYRQNAKHVNSQRQKKKQKNLENDYVSKLAFLVFDFERAHDWNPFFVKNVLIGEKINNDARYY